MPAYILHDFSVHVVQVSPANRAELQQRIRIEALGQGFLHELPKLDTRLQQDLDNGSEHRLRSIDYISRSKEPHSVDEPDQPLFFAAQRDLVVCVSVQEQIRCTHHKVGINGLPFRDLSCDAPIAILRAMRVNGAQQRRTTSYKGPQERRNWAQQCWINVHVASKSVPVQNLRTVVLKPFSKRSA